MAARQVTAAYMIVTVGASEFPVSPARVRSRTLSPGASRRAYLIASRSSDGGCGSDDEGVGYCKTFVTEPVDRLRGALRRNNETKLVAVAEPILRRRFVSVSVVCDPVQSRDAISVT